MNPKGRVKETMAHTEQWLPLGSTDLEFDVYSEMRRATVDLLRRNRPSTVLGALLTYERGLPIDDMAELLEKPVGEVEFTIEPAGAKPQTVVEQEEWRHFVSSTAGAWQGDVERHEQRDNEQREEVLRRAARRRK